jgi:hypothetical protein
MFNFSFLNDNGNYNARKVGRLEREENGGIGVSTAYTSDEGYETALLDANGAHPVERYKDEEKALLGHEKWVKFAKEYKGEKITKLFWSDMPELDSEITLEPRDDEAIRN